MNISISGATGFIGTNITDHLAALGHKITPLTRDIFEPDQLLELQKIINESDVVINLAGERVVGRWSHDRVDAILSSRILVTRAIVRAINRSSKTHLLISASAIGHYPTTGQHDEDSEACGNGFLFNITMAWESEALKLRHTCRLAIARLGIVFDHRDGAFRMISLGHRLGLLLPIGENKRDISWIDIEDLERAMELIIEDERLHGVVNMVAPRPMPYGKLMREIANHYHTRLSIRIPIFVMKIFFGRSAELIYKSQSVLPERLTSFKFKYLSPDIRTFLNKKRG